MDWLSLRSLVMISMGVVFFRHLQGASRTFSLPKGEHPSLRLQLFPLADVAIFYQAARSAPNPWLVVPGLLGFAGSLALFEWARATVRGKFFSFAGSVDEPQFLLTAGPYARVRNPFYASYLLAYLSAAIMLPGWLTLAAVVAMFWFLNSTAKREERKFESSPLAGAYAEYKRRTGRFIPRAG